MPRGPGHPVPVRLAATVHSGFDRVALRRRMAHSRLCDEDAFAADFLTGMITLAGI
ncbi:MAG: hypothetical protein SF002_17975 [Alphaproteobacteria bacterium]|nr:hypothetical protein [Alphaproteobacteria bacterium]